MPGTSVGPRGPMTRTALQGRCHCTHFTDEGTEVPRRGLQPRVDVPRVKNDNCGLLHVPYFLSCVVLFDLNSNL